MEDITEKVIAEGSPLENFMTAAENIIFHGTGFPIHYEAKSYSDFEDNKGMVPVDQGFVYVSILGLKYLGYDDGKSDESKIDLPYVTFEVAPSQTMDFILANERMGSFEKYAEENGIEVNKEMEVKFKFNPSISDRLLFYEAKVDKSYAKDKSLTDYLLSTVSPLRFIN